MAPAELVRTVITGALLFIFVVVFLQEALTIWRKERPPENEARTYIWTAVSVLVGSVTAFVLGVAFPDQAAIFSLVPGDGWRGAYAIVYTAIGFGAVLTWFSRTEYSSVLMKNLATTFLGIAVPVVSSWLLNAQ